MIVITGGAGFIGSNIAHALAKEHDVIIVDNFSNASKHLNINTVPFARVLDKEEFRRRLDQFKDVSTIVHMGACSSTTQTDGAYLLDNNYEYSCELLRFCLDNRIPLVYASSAAVYGDGTQGFSDTGTVEYPLNMYGFSKLAFDKYVRRVLEQGAPSQICGLRFFNVYGPQENHKGDMSSVIFKFYNQWQAGGTIKVFDGSDRFTRDFVYVDDVVAVVRHMIMARASGIFNVGSGKNTSFLDMANAFCEHTGAKIEYIPFPHHLIGKYQEFTCADLTALRSAGFTARFTTPSSGVAQYVEILKRTGGYLKQ